MADQIERVGEIAEIIEENGIEWAVIELAGSAPDTLSVQTSVLQASGVEQINRWSILGLFVNADAKSEIELNATGFHVLTPEEAAQIQNSRRV